jgi:transcriptional regulator with XRE-family HTH domain
MAIERQKLLGQFVRAHRERLAPEASSSRRRTPGLRREEVAARAGISVTWYTWLEQGRDVSLSAHALDRLAAALRLSRAERNYMFDLAGRRDPGSGDSGVSADAPASLVAAVERIGEPAYGLDPLWNACCWNQAAAELFEPWLGGGERNLLRWMFLYQSARRLIEGWEDRARRVLAEFRADFSRSLKDPRMRSLVEALLAEAPLFAKWWDDQLVLEREGGVRRFRHPDRGMISYEQFTFAPADRPDCKLVILTAV